MNSGRTERKLKLTPNTDLHWAPLINNTVQSSIFSTIFGFHESSMTLAVLNGTLLHYFIFPFAAVTEIVAAIVSSINLYSAYNKNYSRVLQLGWDVLKALAVTTVVIGGIVAASLFSLITPIVFTILMGFTTLKDLGLLVWNFTHSQLYKQNDPQLSELYLTETKKNLIGALVSGIMTAAIVSVMLTPVGPMVSAVMSIITASALGLAAIYGVIQGLPFLKKGWLKMTDFVSGLFNNHGHVQNDLDLVDEKNIINEDKKIIEKNALIDLIDHKRATIGRQIDQAKSTYSIWNILIERPQETRRQAKITVLNKYMEMIDQNKTLDDLDSIFDESNDDNNNKIFRKNLSSYAHQSFWSPDRKGGVEKISRKFEKYLMKR